MKKLVLLCAIASLSLVSCTADDVAPLSTPIEQPVNVNNILYINGSENSLNIFYEGVMPNGTTFQGATGQNTATQHTIGTAQLLSWVKIQAVIPTTISLHLNSSNYTHPTPLEQGANYLLTFKLDANGVTIIDSFTKVD